MRHYKPIRFVLTNIAMLGASHLLSQSATANFQVPTQPPFSTPVAVSAEQAEDKYGKRTTTDFSRSSTDEQATSSKPDDERQYAASLDGSGLIALASSRRFHPLAGGSVSSGFDTNPDNLGTGKSSAVYAYSPYLGMQATTDRTEFLLQYHPTFTRYSSYANQSMQVASAALTTRASQRMDWYLGVNASHGNDSVRLLAPAQTVAVGGVPTTGSSAASYLANAGLVTSFDAAFRVNYKTTARTSLSFRGGDSYLSYPSLHDIGKVATSDITYERSLQPTLRIEGYAQSARYYGELACTTVGGGVGIRWQPRADTLLSLRGGPQLDTPSCKSQQGFSYNASFTTKVVGRAQLFFTGSRTPVAGFLGAGLWQDNVTGGYERQIHNKTTIGLNAGYVHSSTLLNLGSYGGTFFDASYLRNIHRGLALACSYRSFNGSSGGTAVNRNILAISLTLSPNTRSLSQ